MKKMILINVMFVLAYTFFSGNFCYGQVNEDNKIIYDESESFLKLPDGIIKREIAFFYIASTIPDSIKITVNEIPLKSCTDSSVYFEKGNIFGNEMEVAINAEYRGQKLKIMSIFSGMYSYGYSLPDSAFNDIYDPIFCKQYTKKNKPILSDCKVYQSSDKKREYIYMINGKPEKKYEITWIMIDGKYYSRIIDYVE